MSSTIQPLPRHRAPSLDERLAPGQAARWRLSGALARQVLLAVVLLGLAVAGELVYLGLWPVSYDLTQGPDFSHEYLLQYTWIWEELFRPIFLWFEQTFPTAATSLEQLTTLLSLFWLVSFGLYFVAFLVARRLPQRWWLAAPVLLAALVFQLTLALMPGIFTTDLFSYAMYGYIAKVYELNPYIYPPGWFPGNRLTAWIHPIWYFTPSIYGPVWLNLATWLAGLTAERSLVDQVLVHRIAANLAHLVNLGLTVLLIRRLAPRRPVALLLLFAWNPLLLFEFAASGHNDALMLTFVLIAALLVSYRQNLLAVVALALAALIKVTPVLLLPLLLVYWAWQQPGLARRLGVLALGGASALLVAVAFYWPWYSGPDTFLLVDYWSKGPMYLNYIPDLLAGTLADQWLDPQLVDQAASWELARTWVKWATRAIFLIYFGWELWRARDARTLLAACSRVFLVFLLLVNTWVLAWYFTWPLMLALPLGWERRETRVLIGFSLSAPLMMYNHHYWSIHMAPWLYLVYLAPLLLLLPPFRSRGDVQRDSLQGDPLRRESPPHQRAATA
jgi:hypothetical protein